MIVLALDGALGSFSCALTGEGRTLAHQAVPANVALEHGLGLVLETMRLAALTPADVDLIAAGTGPGGFTGLRIALSYAKSLALGWRRPLGAVNSFDAIEYGIGEPVRLGVISARKGIASVRLTSAAAQERFSGTTGEIADRVSREFNGRELPVAGAPEDVLAALAERGIHVRPVASSQPPAVAIAQIAAVRDPAPSLHAVRADYGELPAAKVPAKP